MAKSQISSSSSLLSLTSAQVLTPLLFISGVNNIKLRQKKVKLKWNVETRAGAQQSHRKGYFYSKESFINNVKRRCIKSESALVQHELTFRKTREFRREIASQTTSPHFFFFRCFSLTRSQINLKSLVVHVLDLQAL